MSYSIFGLLLPLTVGGDLVAEVGQRQVESQVFGVEAAL